MPTPGPTTATRPANDIEQILAVAIGPPVRLADGNIVAPRRPGGGEYTLCVAVTPYQRPDSRHTTTRADTGLDQRGPWLPAGSLIPIPTKTLDTAQPATPRTADHHLAVANRHRAHIVDQPEPAPMSPEPQHDAL